MATDERRRQFLITLARGALAGVLALGAGYLVTKGDGEHCVADGICTNCRALRDCKLPQALSTRQGLGRKHE